MVLDSEGFLYPEVDVSACTDCGLCEAVCPMTKPQPQRTVPSAFAAWNVDDTVRAASSSGGVFDSLMNLTFHQKGIVFGAAFDKTMRLRHQSADNKTEGCKFRGSKYLQSVIGITYQEAKKYLSQERVVLFSGTPCQIAGLYSFLGRDYDSLLTCDIVCHGVPSPKVFLSYKMSLERRYRSSTLSIDFRCKMSGWKSFSLSLSLENGKKYHRILHEDPFMIGFLRNLFLRPSCHRCLFSRVPRVADISLGDFWGVDKHHPEWDDDRGTSLVLIQTDKGRKAFQSCRKDLTVHEADLNVAIKSNPCISGSLPPGQKRDTFFRDLDRLPFEKVIKTYMMQKTLWHRALCKTTTIVGKILR